MPTKTAKKTALLSDEPTLELVRKARTGDQVALEALLQRCLPPLRIWAHGRLPPQARGYLDTVDLVQEAAMNAIARLHAFEPRRVGAMQAYLRRSVINRIRDEMRRVVRRPVPTELPETLPSHDETAEEKILRKEAYDRYRAALADLRPKDRALVVARMEGQWTVEEIRKSFGFDTMAAARMAVRRAERRLTKALESRTPLPKPKG
jgi:RNA polymerase sigma factor (sigma-70 family)